MLKRIALYAFALLALDAHAARVVIQVDLEARALRLETFNGNDHRVLDMGTLPVVAESFHAGSFKPNDKMYRRFRSINGTGDLGNVIFFNKGRSIRTATPEMAVRGDRTSSSIAIDPDFGSFVFDAIKRAGTENTRIIIIKRKG